MSSRTGTKTGTAESPMSAGSADPAGCSLTEAWGVSSFCPSSTGFSSSHSLSMISAFFRVLIPFNPCAFALSRSCTRGSVFNFSLI